MKLERLDWTDGIVALAVVLAAPIAVYMGFRGFWGLSVATGLVMLMGLGVIAARVDVAGSRVAGALLELLRQTTRPAGTAMVRAMRVEGACPLGVAPGDTWGISRDGWLSHPLCRPAADAVAPLLQRRGEAQRVQCICPLKSRSVWFSVRTAA